MQLLDLRGKNISQNWEKRILNSQVLLEIFTLPQKIAKLKVAMKHITKEQRYAIYLMVKEGFTQSRIAQTIGKDKSTIGRELRRNKDQRSGEYRYTLAHKKATSRKVNKAKYISFTSDIESKVIHYLKEDYSPEQIAGTLKKNGEKTVSHETIYKYIWRDKSKGGTLHEHLRTNGKRYRKRGASKDNRGIIKDRVSIDSRPKFIENRDRFGDLEVDLIIGKNHKQAIVTINDRASGVLKMKKVKSKDSTIVSEAINELLEEWIPFIHTVTSDNGKEFASHKKVAEHLNIDYYFAHPYHSWERGSNENLNGLIRQYFPKKYDFNLITEDKIREVELKINQRPRKRYNFESPLDIMGKLLFNQ